MLLLFAWVLNSARIPVGGYLIPIEMFSVLAMVPIALYSGRKATSSKAVQWGFYLFYPVHLTVLVFVRMLVLNQNPINQLAKMFGL